MTHSKDTNARNARDSAPPADTRKQPYTAPVLREFGRIDHLTRGGTGSVYDNNPGGQYTVRPR
jgi:hypothetical protein